jgi:hypothetical protein
VSCVTICPDKVFVLSTTVPLSDLFLALSNFNLELCDCCAICSHDLASGSLRALPGAGIRLLEPCWDDDLGGRLGGGEAGNMQLLFVSNLDCITGPLHDMLDSAAD